MNVASSAGSRMSTVAASGAFGLVLTSRKSLQLADSVSAPASMNP
jgi:hypothetical protein